LIYLLSKTEDWTVTKTDLERQSDVGGFAIATILKELEDIGYIRREKFQDEKGRWNWRTWVFDQTIHELTVDGEPHDIISTESKQSTTSAGDLVDAMLKYNKKPVSFADYPPDVQVSLLIFQKHFPKIKVDNKAKWIKQARVWGSMGLSSNDIQKMCKYANGKWDVACPASITSAYNMMNSKPEYDAVAERAKSEAKSERR
jgi:hypothetical protein